MKKLMFIIATVMIALSCSVGKNLVKNTEGKKADLKEVAGVYRGVVPCADCEGIKTEIVLDETGRYNLSRSYLGRKGARFHDNGIFSYDKSSGKLMLTDRKGDPEGKYLLEGDSLFMLDYDGNKIEGELADMYILERAPEYELIVFDQGFEYWLRSNHVSEDYYSNDYLQSANIRYVQEWNSRYLRGDRRFESYVDYDPSTRYNKDFNYKLFMYFRYFEETNRIKLL